MKHLVIFFSIVMLINTNSSAQTFEGQKKDSCGIDQLEIYLQTQIEERAEYFREYLKKGQISLVLPDLILLDLTILGSMKKINPLIFLDGSFLGWQLVDTFKLDSIINLININANYTRVGNDNCSEELLVFDSDPECFKLLRNYLSCSACRRIEFLSNNFSVLAEENPWFISLAIKDLNTLSGLTVQGNINNPLNVQEWKNRLSCKE